MNDFLESIRGWTATTEPPELDALRNRSSGRDGRSAPLAALLVLALVAGLTVAGFAAQRDDDNGSATAAESTPVTSAPVAAAYIYSFQVSTDEASPFRVRTLPYEAEPQGSRGGVSTDVYFLNGTDGDLVLTPPDWDAAGQGIVMALPCEPGCRPEVAGDDIVVGPGAEVVIPLLTASGDVGSTTLEIPYAWRPVGGNGGSEQVLALTVTSSEAPDGFAPHATDTTAPAPR